MQTEPIILNKAQFTAIRREILSKMNNRQEFLFQLAKTVYKRLQNYEKPTLIDVLHEIETIHEIESVDETNLLINSLFDSDITFPKKTDFIYFTKKMFFICEDNCIIGFSVKHSTFFIEGLNNPDVMNKDRTYLNKVLVEVFRGRN